MYLSKQDMFLAVPFHILYECYIDHVIVYNTQLGHEYHYRQDVMTFYILLCGISVILTSFSPSPSPSNQGIAGTDVAKEACESSSLMITLPLSSRQSNGVVMSTIRFRNFSSSN